MSLLCVWFFWFNLVFLCEFVINSFSNRKAACAEPSAAEWQLYAVSERQYISKNEGGSCGQNAAFDALTRLAVLDDDSDQFGHDRSKSAGDLIREVI